ncbi:MAG: tRNA pseudouridine(38-40) synthase TruA [Saprospirales bacterium]|nr:MAG: tRNA pseudouridine(38-40) synthase TruA [Saprospirales bacterium]
MRYFGSIAFNGTSFVGWQNQPNGVSVQATLEKAIATITQKKVNITGCGRTDAGVHASCFYFHFDAELNYELGHFVFKMNALLPDSIYIEELIPVGHEAHARFDAHHRTYRYYISGIKNPFKIDQVFWFRQFKQLDIEILTEAAKILANGEDFYAFSKTNTDVKNYRCNIYGLSWCQLFENTLVMEISANRFLRGMVRLMVGACLNAGLGKTSLEEIHSAIHHQKRLEKAWSVPAHGLYLTDVRYPFLNESSVEKAYFFEPFGPFSQ